MCFKEVYMETRCLARVGFAVPYARPVRSSVCMMPCLLLIAVACVLRVCVCVCVFRTQHTPYHRATKKHAQANTNENGERKKFKTRGSPAGEGQHKNAALKKKKDGDNVLECCCTHAHAHAHAHAHVYAHVDAHVHENAHVHTYSVKDVLLPTSIDLYIFCPPRKMNIDVQNVQINLTILMCSGFVYALGACSWGSAGSSQQGWVGTQCWQRQVQGGQTKRTHGYRRRSSWQKL